MAEIWHERPGRLQGDQYDAVMNYPLGAAITSFVGAGRLDRRVLAAARHARRGACATTTARPSRPGWSAR